MRFKKGSKVEVLKKSEVPSGSWWCGEIISGNGHNYHVRYHKSPDGTIVERVSRKAIRPLPPPLVGMENWFPGDIVEVFDSNSWKVAEITKVVGGDYFFVRILGSSLDFEIHNSNLRVRQSLQDNKWVVIRKDSWNCKDKKPNKAAPLMEYQKSICHLPLPDLKAKACAADEHVPFEGSTAFQLDKELHGFSARRGMKRASQYGFSHTETKLRLSPKVRVTEKEGRPYRLAPRHKSPLLEKVDAVASPRTMLGEKYMHASFNNRTIGLSEMGLARNENANAEDSYFFRRSLETNSEADSSACSVASCSNTTHDPFKLPHLFRAGPSQDSYSDDAESSSSDGWGNRRKSSPYMKEGLAAEIHKLELHAYRSTMKALYASGPLSWEQEEMMTNLRLTLNISNDEHLLELRHLVSAEC